MEVETRLLTNLRNWQFSQRLMVRNAESVVDRQRPGDRWTRLVAFVSLEIQVCPCAAASLRPASWIATRANGLFSWL